MPLPDGHEQDNSTQGTPARKVPEGQPLGWHRSQAQAWPSEINPLDMSPYYLNDHEAGASEAHQCPCLMVFNKIDSHPTRRGEAPAPPRADLKVGPYEVSFPAWPDGVR